MGFQQPWKIIWDHPQNNTHENTLPIKQNVLRNMVLQLIREILESHAKVDCWEITGADLQKTEGLDALRKSLQSIPLRKSSPPAALFDFEEAVELETRFRAFDAGKRRHYFVEWTRFTTPDDRKVKICEYLTTVPPNTY
jgi:hypothetical protein